MGMGGRPGGPMAGRMGPHGGMNLTEGPIAKTLIMFSLPLLGSNALQSATQTVNAIWVSHLLGPQALTATVNAQQLMFLLMGAVMGVGMASNIVVAQAYGANQHDQVKSIVGTSASFFLGASVLMALIGIVFTPGILDLMHAPPDSRELAIEYLRWTCGSMPVVFFFFFAMMIMRGSGNSQTPFYFSLVSIALNIVLVPVLMTGFAGLPRMGIAGAAAAGLISQAVALIAMMVHLYRTNHPLVLRRRELHHLKPQFDILQVLLVRGVPMGLQMFIMSGAGLIMMGLVNGHGSLTAAAYGGAMQLWSYVQMPAMALGASVSSMAAQNVGAGRWDRVNQLALTGSLIGIAITGSVVLLLYALGPIPLLMFLPPNSEALNIAVEINHYVLWGWIPFAITFVLFGVVRATGAIIPPMIVLFISLWLVRVPFAQYFDNIIGREAIWWSFPLGTFGSALLAFLYYRYGAWRSKTMLSFGPGGMQRGPGMMQAGAAAPFSGAAAAGLTPGDQIIPIGPPAELRTGATAIADLQRDIEAMQRRLNLSPETEAAQH